jgi:hypothetical protein
MLIIVRSLIETSLIQSSLIFSYLLTVICHGFAVVKNNGVLMIVIILLDRLRKHRFSMFFDKFGKSVDFLTRFNKSLS